MFGQSSAIHANHLNGQHPLSLSSKNAIVMVYFGLALGCQISEAEKVNTAAKLTTECVIGGVLFGCFIGLLAANLANRPIQKERVTYQFQSYCSPVHNSNALETEKSDLERMYHYL